MSIADDLAAQKQFREAQARKHNERAQQIRGLRDLGVRLHGYGARDNPQRDKATLADFTGLVAEYLAAAKAAGFHWEAALFGDDPTSPEVRLVSLCATGKAEVAAQQLEDVKTKVGERECRGLVGYLKHLPESMEWLFRETVDVGTKSPMKSAAALLPPVALPANDPGSSLQQKRGASKKLERNPIIQQQLNNGLNEKQVYKFLQEHHPELLEIKKRKTKDGKLVAAQATRKTVMNAFRDWQKGQGANPKSISGNNLSR